MLLFKYPLQKRKFDKLYGAVQKEADAAGIPEEEIRKQAQLLLEQLGVTQDLDNLACDEYTDVEIKQDAERIEYEQALSVIEEAEAARRQQELDLVAD